MTITTRAGKGSALTNAEIDANVTTLDSEKMAKAGDTMSGSLTFDGSSRRILADLSNATHANRLLFQSTVPNSSSAVGVMPSGTGTGSSFKAYNSTDLANANALSFDVVGTTDARLQSLNYGTASVIPMTFYVGGAERIRIGSDHSSSTHALQVTGTGTPAGSGGLELHLISSEGYVQAYNRTGAAWLSLLLRGLAVQLWASGAHKGGVDSNGMYGTAMQKAGDPDSTDIAEGVWRVVKNTSSGAVKLWYNDGGSLKSVALS